MPDRYSELVERLKTAVLNTRGVTDSALRRAIETRAAIAGGRPASPAPSLPADVERYVDLVARHAYRVTDADVQSLKQAGYPEDAIFEITASAAVGAGVGRLEAGMRVLREARGT